MRQLARVVGLGLVSLWCACFIGVAAGTTFYYRVLATSKTSTMEKEMNEAADAGFVFGAVMGGTVFGSLV